MKIDMKKTFHHVSENESHALLAAKFAAMFGFFMLIILVLFVVLHTTSTRKSSEEFWYQNEAAFENSVTLLENDLGIIDSYCRQLVSESDLYSLARMEDTTQSSFYIRGYRFKQTMSSGFYAYQNLPVNSYFIYLHNTGYVASLNTFRSDSLYFSRNYAASSDFEGWQAMLLADNGSGTLYPLTDLVISGSDDAYLYLVDLNTLTYRSVSATAGFHFSYSKLKDIFSGNSLENGGCLLVLDENGEPVFYFLEGSDDRNNIEETDYNTLASALSSPDVSPVCEEFEYNGIDMHITRVESDFNGWTYYLVQPVSLFATPYQGLFILIIVAALCVCLLLIIWLVKKSMHPIVQLDSELQETITDRNQLQEALDSAKPIIYHNYLKQLMSGNISTPDELEYIRSFLHLENPDLQYYVMYGIIYENELMGDTENTDPENENQDEIVRIALSEYFSYESGLYLFSPKDRVYALLLPFAGEADSELISIQERVLKLHSELLEEHSIWFFAGVGRACSLSNVWESYQQAKEVSGYTAKNYIFLPYEMLKKDSRAYYYPVEFSTRLIQSITTGSKSQVNELFSLIHQENIEERALSIHLLNFLISDIRNTLLKARFAVANVSAENEELLANIDSLLNTENMNFRLCHDIAIKLCDLFRRKTEENSLIDTIVDYIRTNFRNPSLCLNKISDEFGISESYFSHMFKETMNINFSVYLEDMRLNEAARLIKEGNSNLTEISEEVGYNNITSFRRAFKKKFGVTPSAMASS